MCLPGPFISLTLHTLFFKKIHFISRSGEIHTETKEYVIPWAAIKINKYIFLF